MRKCCCVFLFLCSLSLSAEEWYISDASGLAFELCPPVVALRAEYALSIDGVSGKDASAWFQEQLTSRSRVELSSLYHKGEKTRSTWKLLDENGLERASEKCEKDGSSLRELFDEKGRFIEESRLSREGEGTLIRYFYQKDQILRAEAFFLTSGNKGERPLWTDTYGYDRSGSLRLIERKGSEGSEAGQMRSRSLQGVPRELETSSTGNRLRSTYDASGRQTKKEVFDIDGKKLGEQEITDYAKKETSKATRENAVRQIQFIDGSRKEQTLDSRGRIVKEILIGSDAKIVEETLYTWSKDHIESFIKIRAADEFKTEYEYDSGGSRSAERNFKNGVLERSLINVEGKEIEELYLNGSLILRVIWEKGQKISEKSFSFRGLGND
ncbi:hypothetical protein MASR2M78_00230 [Treponema sp.]